MLDRFDDFRNRKKVNSAKSLDDFGLVSGCRVLWLPKSFRSTEIPYFLPSQAYLGRTPYIGTVYHCQRGIYGG